MVSNCFISNFVPILMHRDHLTFQTAASKTKDADKYEVNNSEGEENNVLDQKHHNEKL
jgi:hypothetical protein